MTAMKCVNKVLVIDSWAGASTEVIPADDFDRQYFGEDVVRVKTFQPLIPTLPVRIVRTGKRAKVIQGIYSLRVRIEFLLDGQPSEYSGGWIDASAFL